MIGRWVKPEAKREFERWIADYHGSLFRHALWLTGNKDIAADMVQEAFYQAWRSLASLKEPDKALPWLLAILRRCVYREQRQQYRHRETLQWLEGQAPVVAGDAGYQWLLIYGALAQLSIKHREVFLLHHLHGFSYEEISTQLEIPKGTVMSRLARAREALQQLDAQGQEDKVVDLASKKQETSQHGQ